MLAFEVVKLTFGRGIVTPVELRQRLLLWFRTQGLFDVVIDPVGSLGAGADSPPPPPDGTPGV
ncbi:MAG TPA: hypothetical protein DDZ05_02850 [Candidatus Blackburnbacteria bacterium]|uniref:Uncharacterized protein n=1 Tax=Candidatus Blackburnbacteria bacterium RIFCSPLOWO2_01_FULL_40_20 TaxID=1797519 RepID=A0A1G1VAV3_9BACT|nr:MAG: hypothetical protein A3A77_00735 [Candidatus Blackburnbacteria bacterium RIFCSPLOWO2_01_FULL_40_20]HBL52132.1 hypothetical protein [Candidatus Blackburnbacteria bacterium]